MTQIDPYELKILKILQVQGRKPVSELAEDIGLSTTPTARRFDHLMSSGIITGFSAQLDRRALGLKIEVLVGVSLISHSDDILSAFIDTIMSMESVVNCWALTGSQDFMLHVILPDIDSLDHFVMGTLLKMTGVRDVKTNVVLNNIKGPSPLPLGHVIPSR